MKQNQPIPANEMDRLLSLADLDVDYSSLNENFKDLTNLAAKVAGTDISLINLIDSFTQWTISNHGLSIDQMPREESVCQYTIMGNGHFEVPNLSQDERFKDKSYVGDPLSLTYYMGVPLQTSSGINIGALCLLDQQQHQLTPEKIEMLKIIADEIVNRLKSYKAISSLNKKLEQANESKKKVAHDIRGPLAGIIGLSEIISAQGDENSLAEVLEFINLIHKSSKSLLELADEILTVELPNRVREGEFNLLIFKDKLEKLFGPQAMNKNITLLINSDPAAANVAFSKNKLLQITGNLISNAIKFTPLSGKVTVSLSLQLDVKQNNLRILVSDTGIGMDQATIQQLLTGDGISTDGTTGEKGYGFGLALVKHLIDSLKGTLQIGSKPGQGAIFEVNLPQLRS